MLKFVFFLCTIVTLTHSEIQAHCQLPCGIYHDNMVFDQIDQYVETMYKGVVVMNESKFTTVREKNEFIRWVINKEKESDDTSRLILTYFLQQKIKPADDDSPKRLASAHKLLFLLVQIKQNAEVKIIEAFSKEWDKFKLMFHTEGYECQIEMEKARRKALDAEKANTPGAVKAAVPENVTPDHSHDHDHDHDHDHNHDHDFSLGQILTSPKTK